MQLEVDDIATIRGRVQVLHQVSLHVSPGEVVALLGPNGAGKSTLLGTLMGLYSTPTGRVRYGGQDITRIPMHRRVARGLAIAPERRQLFPHLTVEDNLRLGAFHRRRTSVSWETELQAVWDLFPGLVKHRRRLAGWLSGGEQQMVAIGRALMARPGLLLLDEPSLGLAPVIVREVFDALSRLRREGLTILLVEQNIHYALELASRAYVLSQGQIVFEGSRDEARKALEQGYLTVG